MNKKDDDVRVQLKDGTVEYVKEERLDEFLQENTELTKPREFPGVEPPIEGNPYSEVTANGNQVVM